MSKSHGLFIAALDVMDISTGFWFDNFLVGGPMTGVPEVSGERVLVPGAPGYFTPPDNFEVRHMEIRLKGSVWGIGLTSLSRRVDLRDNIDALKAALDTDGRADVTLTAKGPQIEGLDTGMEATIAAGFLGFESPVPYGWEVWETVIELDATADPCDWAVTEPS